MTMPAYGNNVSTAAYDLAREPGSLTYADITAWKIARHMLSIRAAEERLRSLGTTLADVERRSIDPRDPRGVSDTERMHLETSDNCNAVIATLREGWSDYLAVTGIDDLSVERLLSLAEEFARIIDDNY